MAVPICCPGQQDIEIFKCHRSPLSTTCHLEGGKNVSPPAWGQSQDSKGRAGSPIFPSSLTVMNCKPNSHWAPASRQWLKSLVHKHPSDPNREVVMSEHSSPGAAPQRGTPSLLLSITVNITQITAYICSNMYPLILLLPHQSSSFWLTSK